MVALSHGITPQEYLEQERKAAYKSEYINGRIYAMSGGSRQHSVIAVHIGTALDTQFEGRTCDVYNSDVRVKVNETGMYTYPDVSAVCGEPVFEDSVVDTLTNPTLIVEVLSPSTEAYDRGSKFEHYRYIPTLQEYVLVTQNRPLVEKYTRQGELWTLTTYRGLDAVLDMDSVECRIPLRKIYGKVLFLDDVEIR